jgi:hypothetical protein
MTNIRKIKKRNIASAPLPKRCSVYAPQCLVCESYHHFYTKGYFPYTFEQLEAYAETRPPIDENLIEYKWKDVIKEIEDGKNA